MKSIAIVLLMLGLVFGVGQFFVIYEKSFVSKAEIWEWGGGGVLPDTISYRRCIEETEGTYCTQRYTKLVRGFPFSVAGPGKDHEQIDYRHFVNFILLVLPGISLFAFVRLKK
jgi:hypothetical protein